MFFLPLNSIHRVMLAEKRAQDVSSANTVTIIDWLLDSDPTITPTIQYTAPETTGQATEDWY